MKKEQIYKFIEDELETVQFYVRRSECLRKKIIDMGIDISNEEMRRYRDLKDEFNQCVNRLVGIRMILSNLAFYILGDRELELKITAMLNI